MYDVRRSTGNAPVPCVKCGRPTTNPRRGLCDKHYLEAYTGRVVGPACEVCGNQDPRVLGRRRLDGCTWSTLCSNCSAVAGKRTLTVGELALEVRPPGDRRQQDRRGGADRRHLERRREVDVVRLLDDRREGGRRGSDQVPAPEAPGGA